MFRTQKQRMAATFAGIVLLTIVALLINFGSWYNAKKPSFFPKVKEVPFQLGLDLVGGTHLVYKADVSKVDAQDQASAVAGVRDVIERRVNTFGVSEPIVQTSEVGGEHRIIVELAGIKDINEAIKRIGETPLLEFKEENEQAQQERTLTPDQEKEIQTYNQEARQRAQDVLTKALAGNDFASLAKESSEDTATKDKGGNLDWQTSVSLYPELVKAVETLEPGKVAPNVIESAGTYYFQGGPAAGYNIVKLNEKRIQKDEGLGLEKKEFKASHLLICYQGATNCTGTLSKEDAKKKIDELKKQATPQNFAELAAKNSTEPNAAQSKGDLGWFSQESMVKPFADAVAGAAKGSIIGPVETEFGYHIIYKQDERPLYEYNISRILITTKTKDTVLGPPDAWKSTKLTGEHLERASVQFNQSDGAPEILLEFNNDGSKLFEEITTRNVGRPVAIFLDGEPLSIPTVNQAITTGEAVITGSFTIVEAKELAQNLNAGALPVPIEIVNQKTIGASLGKVSVDKSLQAGFVGLALIAVFMIALYRFPGFLAVISLCLYGIFSLAIFKLAGVTLTLAGIAGFILSIGMAVDANILIFARLREELHGGKTMALAMAEAFRRAWPSIRDGNASTLLTCIILFYFTTGVVKGFAVTLIFGIFVSMFSAIIVTRNFMELTMKDGREHAWLYLGNPAKKE